jgi:adiponectin receptor
VEECLRFPFIDYGYRDTKSFRDTFFTLFSFHNETMNIWSHLIGFFCVLVAGYHVAAEMMSTNDLHIFEMIAFETFIVCAALCLLLSAVYHWFGCISEAYHNCLLRVDITGVGLLVAGSYFPAVYYGFYCSPDIQMAHFGLTILILCAGMAAPWVDYKINGFAVRPFLLASLVFIGVIPFGQWLYITPDVYRNEVTKEFVLMFLWYGMGFTLYLTKFPERFFPNSFVATQVFASHALWHMCVLGAVYTSFHFYIQYQALLRSHGCAAYQGLPDDISMVSPVTTCVGEMINGTCAAAY